MSQMFKRNTSDQRLLKSPWTAQLWRYMGIEGIYVERTFDLYTSFRMSSVDRFDVQTWAGDSLIQSLGTLVRRHPAFVNDPIIKMIYVRVLMDYINLLVRERDL